MGEVAAPVAAVGSVIGGVIGGNNSSKAAQSAANAQAAAAGHAADLQMEQYRDTKSALMPFINASYSNVDEANDFHNHVKGELQPIFDKAMGAVPTAFPTVPQPMTYENLVNTPGYQFNLQQGLRAVANSNAAQGLGVSGAALTGAAKYATGLADSTYQQQFANQQALFGNQQAIFGDQQSVYNDYLNAYGQRLNGLQQEYNTLVDPINRGVNAITGVGQQGVQAAGNAGQAIQQQGVAQSAGVVGQANAQNSMINSLTNAPIQYLALQNALNGGYNLTPVQSPSSNPFDSNGNPLGLY